jgi:hypothetical protein
MTALVVSTAIGELKLRVHLQFLFVGQHLPRLLVLAMAIILFLKMVCLQVKPSVREAFTVSVECVITAQLVLMEAPPDYPLKLVVALALLDSFARLEVPHQLHNLVAWQQAHMLIMISQGPHFIAQQEQKQ